MFNILGLEFNYNSSKPQQYFKTLKEQVDHKALGYIVIYLMNAVINMKFKNPP